MPGPGHWAIPSQAGRASDPGSNKFLLALRTWICFDKAMSSVFKTPRNKPMKTWTMKGERTPHLFAQQRLRRVALRQVMIDAKQALSDEALLPDWISPQPDPETEHASGACRERVLLGFYICASIYSLIYVGEYIYTCMHRPTHVYMQI